MSGSRGQLSDKVLFYLFALFLFSSTFSIALSQAALGLSLITFVIVMAARRYQPFVGSLKWFYALAGLYTGWLIFTSLINSTPAKSLIMIREEWLFVAVPIAIYLFGREGHGRRLVFALAGGVAVVSLYGVIQYVTGADISHSAGLVKAPAFGYRIQGNFSTRLTFANYFGTAGMFLLGYAITAGEGLSRVARRILVIVAILAAVVSLLTFSRVSIGAVGVTLIILILVAGKRYRLSIIGLIAVIIAVTLFVPGILDRVVDASRNDLNPEYPGGRLFIWKNSVDIIEKHPFFGVGQGNFYDEYRARLPEGIPEYRQLTHAHNDFLNVAAISGIPGMLLFVAMWVAVMIYIRRAYNRPGASGWERRLALGSLLGSVMFLLTSLSEATFADEEVRQLLMFVWAAGLSLSYKKPTARGETSPTV